jgi:hypothetical protein
MNRTIPLSLTLAVALASQVALGGCSKKEEVGTPPGDTASSAPSMGSTSTMGASSAPMDSISSASAVAGSDAAASAASGASR